MPRRASPWARDKVDAASFSRQQELEADQIGTVMMARAGFDPAAAVSFLDSMEAYTRYRAGGAAADRLDFLASHPAAPQRLSKLRSLASSLEGQATARERDRYLSGIDGMVFGDAASGGFVRGNAYVHPGLGVRFEVPSDFELENATDAVLATGPGDVALRFDGVAAEGARSDSLSALGLGGRSRRGQRAPRDDRWAAGRDGARACRLIRLRRARGAGRRSHLPLPHRRAALGRKPDGARGAPSPPPSSGWTRRSAGRSARCAWACAPGADASAMRGVERGAALYEVLNEGAPDNLRKVVTE